MKRFLSLLLPLCLLAACGAPPPPSPSVTSPPLEEVVPLPPAPPTNQERAAELISSMTVEEQVGQLIFARCPASGAAELIAESHVGGLLLFGRDFQDKTADAVIQSNREYQRSAKIPLLIGVDEEGGTVVRLSSNPHLRTTKYAAPQRIFANGSWEGLVADTVEKDALLRAMGINVNLAPVADLSTDSADFIYARSFGKNAQETAKFVETVVGQMAADGMGSVLKHFPGYGNNVDTHIGIARDSRPPSQLAEHDFLPFAAGIEAGGETTAVLVSHNILETVDEQLPASLSPNVLALLRNDLGFTGVAMTDDLAMAAVRAYTGDGSAALLAVVAGNDLLITSDPLGDIANLLAALDAGELSQERLEEAVQRVVVWKMALGLL